ncbi:hypothetical protein Hamer_G001052 [Homarus americanus]|uniref:Uncharacterized protein n=1 Tax=Homarus americanus TaxID=6706 RepID=A0A8J5T2F4_HOMAM|nr:hypothetical protein Hamer_G001052 [Homarus americanus]
MPKRKCKFTVELQSKLPCFKRGRDEWEAQCLVCKPGTYVSVANKGINDLQTHVNSDRHKKAVQGEGSSMKLTEFFVKPGSKTEDAVTAAEGTYAFHTVNITIASRP